jgi:uncharacterized protein (TIGR00730 family)
VFGGARLGTSPTYRDYAANLGRQLAEGDFEIVFGGVSIGCMGALADGALQAGGRVIGVIPQQMLDVGIGHPNLTEIHVVTTMHERKSLMAELADAFVAVPGGLGTAEELFEILTWRQLGLHGKPCLLLDVKGYWATVRNCLDHWIVSGFVGQEDLVWTSGGRYLPGPFPAAERGIVRSGEARGVDPRGSRGQAQGVPAADIDADPAGEATQIIELDLGLVASHAQRYGGAPARAKTAVVASVEIEFQLATGAVEGRPDGLGIATGSRTVEQVAQRPRGHGELGQIGHLNAPCN